MLINHDLFLIFHLILATEYGHKEVAELLIDFKVEFNAQDNKGRTALHLGLLLSM